MTIKHLNIIIFCVILMALGVFNILTPKEQVKIESENRLTKPVPEFSFEGLFAGEYFKEFDSFFADNFVMRDTYVSVSNKVKSFKGLNMGDKVEIVEYAGANVDQEVNTISEDSHQAQSEDSPSTSQSGEGAVHRDI